MKHYFIKLKVEQSVGAKNKTEAIEVFLDWLSKGLGRQEIHCREWNIKKRGKDIKLKESKGYRDYPEPYPAGERS